MRFPSEPHLFSKLATVSFPTLGHFLEDGFANHHVRAIVPDVKVVGRAVTLRLTSPDAIAVNNALAQLKPGDVLVIDMNGDHEHAPIGAVTACAAINAGASAIIVDGAVTDLLELRQTRLPVFARGSSLLTTKKLGDDTSVFNGTVMCAGVQVRPGDIVLADDNGILFSNAHTLAEVVDRAIASDLEEPATLRRLNAEQRISDVLQCSARASIHGTNSQH